MEQKSGTFLLKHIQMNSSKRSSVLAVVGLLCMEHEEECWQLIQVTVRALSCPSSCMTLSLVGILGSGCLGKPLMYLPWGHISISGILHSVEVERIYFRSCPHYVTRCLKSIYGLWTALYQSTNEVYTHFRWWELCLSMFDPQSQTIHPFCPVWL